ncbi:MAG: hypothetical protein D4R40_01625 [Nitrosomonadaceae bacterium]|nr:MAG: hypothetical protein D4R40_01625 [Nitrosomonadaceae bacterium]
MSITQSVSCRCLRLSIGFLLVAVPPFVFAQQHTVESVAAEIARQHNTNAKALLDEMTASTSARAIGKNVIFEYVLRVKQGLPPSKLTEFQAETYKEVVPRACQVNVQNEAFKKGLYYTLIYRSTYGEKLAEFVVNKATCGIKQ